MKNCLTCNEPLYRTSIHPVCHTCRKNARCECGNSKDYRAKQCRSCGSREVAKKQWQRLRPQMEKSLRAFAATRKGKAIKPERFCSMPDCNNRYESRGLCHKHYARWKHHGTAELQTPTALERFWSRVQKTDGCWLWTGTVNEHGYGLISVNRRQERAHRYSFFLAYGKWPFPMGRHTCDNPRCVRPDHIVEGNQFDNVQDRVERNRQPRGSEVGGSKLTEADVIEIKKMLKAKIFQRVIAERFGVHQGTIHSIKHGKTWKHVE